MTTEPSNPSVEPDPTPHQTSHSGSFQSNTVVDEEQSRARPALGEQFQRRRLALNLSILEVSEQIKWSVKQIEALENNRWNELPKTTILKGFIRAYARLLNFDPDPVLHALQLDAQTPEAAMPPAHISGDDAPRRLSASHANDYGLGRAWPIRRIMTIIFAVVLLLMIAFKLVPAALRWFESNSLVSKHPSVNPMPSNAVTSSASTRLNARDEQPSDRPVLAVASALMAEGVKQQAQQALVPQASTTQPPVLSLSRGVSTSSTRVGFQRPTSTDAAKLKVMFHGDAWIEVRDAQGSVLLSERGSPGELREVEGKPPYQLTIRNAAKLELWLSQRKIPLPAQRDDQLSHFRVL